MSVTGAEVSGVDEAAPLLHHTSTTTGHVLLHVLLTLAAVSAYVAHLGVLVRPEPAKRVRWWPAFSRQLPKVSCLLGVALGSPLARRHLALSPALDLVLLALQFVTQEVKGGAPVDDVALALPLDLCLSFVLLGVAQHCQPAVALHFSWVVASIVMSISVSTIPLVFGHKPPISGSLSFSLGASSAAAPLHRARFAPVTPSPGGATTWSHHSGRSFLPPSTVTPESSMPPSRGSSVHNLTAAHLEHLNRAQGWYTDCCHSPGCGSSSSSVVEQIMQHGQAPRVTAKPLHRVDRVSLPSNGCSSDPAAALTIMRSQGMAIEMMDKHGRSLRYDSRVRRQRVYIKTGVGVAKDAQLQQLLPRVQRTLQSQPPAGPAAHTASQSEGASVSSTPTNHDRQGHPQIRQEPKQDTHSSSYESATGSSSTTTTSRLAPTATHAPAPQTNATAPHAHASCVDSTSSSSSSNAVHNQQSATEGGNECLPPPLPPQQQQQSAVRQQQLQGGATMQAAGPEVQRREQMPASQNTAVAREQQQQQQKGAAQQEVPAPMQQQQQQQQQQQPATQVHAQPQQAVPQQPQQQQHNHRPAFGGVYVRDGCVELTLDVLSFTDAQQPCNSLSSGSTSGDSSSSNSSSSAPASPPLALSHLGPGNCLELMGLSHKLPQPHSWEPVSNSRPTEHTGDVQQQQQEAGVASSECEGCVEKSMASNSSTSISSIASHSSTHSYGAYVRLQLDAGQATHTWQHAAHAQQQQQQQQQQQSTQTPSHANALDAPPQLLSVHPLITLDSAHTARTHSRASSSTCSADSTVTHREYTENNGGANQSLPLCLHVLLPHISVSHNDSCADMCVDSLSVTARHRGRFLPARVTSCHIVSSGSSCCLDNCSVSNNGSSSNSSSSSSSSSCSCSCSNSGSGSSGSQCVRDDSDGCGKPAVAELWVELQGPLLPGLVHFEVHAPGTSAPSSPLRMLVVSRAHEGMASELQQLQHSSAQHAREAALLLAGQMVTEAHSGKGCRQEAQPATAACPLLQRAHRSGSHVLLHDVGTWMELAEAQQTLLHNTVHSSSGSTTHTAAGTAAAAPVSAGPSTPSLGKSSSPASCAPGSIDLTPEFERGLAASAEAAAAEVRALTCHLHATALALGWPCTAHVLSSFSSSIPGSAPATVTLRAAAARMLRALCHSPLRVARHVLSVAACVWLLLGVWRQSSSVLTAPSGDSWGFAAVHHAGGLAALLLLEGGTRAKRSSSSSSMCEGDECWNSSSCGHEGRLCAWLRALCEPA